MGNSAIQSTFFPDQSEPLTRYGGLFDENKLPSRVGGGYFEDAADSDMGIIIIYANAIEHWNRSTGDRISRENFGPYVIHSCSYGKYTILGSIVLLGLNTGNIIVLSSDLNVVKKRISVGQKSSSDMTLTDKFSGDIELAIVTASQAMSTIIDITYLSVPFANIMLVGDASCGLRIFSLSSGEEVVQLSISNIIKER
jgi:hypothetical protein